MDVAGHALPLQSVKSSAFVYPLLEAARSEAGDRLARLQTAGSLGPWLGVVICGRWIAYR